MGLRMPSAPRGWSPNPANWSGKGIKDALSDFGSGYVDINKMIVDPTGLFLRAKDPTLLDLQSRADVFGTGARGYLADKAAADTAQQQTNIALQSAADLKQAQADALALQKKIAADDLAQKKQVLADQQKQAAIVNAAAKRTQKITSAQAKRETAKSTARAARGGNLLTGTEAGVTNLTAPLATSPSASLLKTLGA